MPIPPIKRLLRAFIPIVLVVVTIICAVAWERGLLSGEPVYRGRSTSSWLKRITYFSRRSFLDVELGSSAVMGNDPALIALVTMGRKAVPTLLKTLTSPIPDAPREHLFLNGDLREAGEMFRYKVFGTFPFSPEYQRPGAGLVLLGIGQKEGGGVARFLQAYADCPPEARSFVTYCLDVASLEMVDRHAEIREGIAVGMESKNGDVRQLCARAAVRFPESAIAWKPRLIELAGDREESVRVSALRSLTYLHTNDMQVFAIVQTVMSDVSKSPGERIGAIWCLTRLGGMAIPCIPFLRTLKNDPNQRLRESARNSLSGLEYLAKNAPAPAVSVVDGGSLEKDASP